MKLMIKATKAVTKMTLKTTIAALAVPALLAGGLAPRAAGQTRPAPAAPAQNPAQQNFDAVQMQVLHVQGNVYMIAGAGGNTTVQAGDSGVLVVDTQFAPLSAKLLAAIRTFSPKPIHYIINTHVHDDQARSELRLRQGQLASWHEHGWLHDVVAWDGLHLREWHVGSTHQQW